MGNSTRTLQSLVDGVSTIGDLDPVFKNAGGYAAEPALTIANAAMSDLLAQRFPFKWNRIKITPFLLTSAQQDYATVGLRNLGWLEAGAAIDINNTSIPQPSYPIQAVRDLPFSGFTGGPATEIASMLNEQLEYGAWPGAGKIYSTPLGATVTPINPPTNIQDANGVILILTTYGVTGVAAPVAPVGALPGAILQDGTCVWTIADAGATGFRVSPRPPQSGNVWLVRAWGQAAARRFTSLSQTLDPIPDDFSTWFEDGFIAYAHRHSANPQVKNRFPQMRQQWMEAMTAAMRQGARETESYGFVPSRTIMEPSFYSGMWPLPGRRIS